MEERSRKEHNEQDAINQNLQTSVKTLSMRIGQVDTKIFGVDGNVSNIMQQLQSISPNQNWTGMLYIVKVILGGSGQKSELFKTSSPQEMIEELARDLEGKYTEIIKKIATERSETHDSVASLKEALKTKVSAQKLEEAEERIQELIDKVVANVNKRFMDRKELKKTLKQFEDKVGSVFDVVANKVDEFEVNEAMLLKKSANSNVACASCTKQIFNNNTNLAEHIVNNRLPAGGLGKERTSHKNLSGVSKLITNYNLQANHLQSQSVHLQYST